MDQIPVKYVDEYETKEYLSAKWLKIFHHNSSLGHYFTEKDATLFLGNETVSREYKFSILKYLPFIKTYEKNVYEFILDYPTLKNIGSDEQHKNTYNHWKQTSNPCLSNIVTGYEAINITWDQGYWVGLRKFNDNTYICGSNISTGYWHYAIGAFTYFNHTNIENLNTIPGPYEDYGIHVKAVDLWIRVANFSNMICFDTFTCHSSLRSMSLNALMFAIFIGHQQT